MAPDGPPNPANAYASFSADEVRRLERYATRVEKLEATPFMRATDVRFSLGMAVGRPLTATVSGISDEELEHGLLLLRPLWLQEEKAGFWQLQATVKQHAHRKNSAEGRQAIEHIKNHTQLLKSILDTPERVSLREQHVDQHGAVVSEEDVTPRRIVEDFFHGVYFHEDEERIARIGDSFRSEFQRFHFITTLRDIAAVYRSFATIVEGILAEPTLRV